MKIFSLEQVDSTNTLALELAANGSGHGTVVWAKNQTGGRGQQGRIFASPLGGLYFSLLLQPDLAATELPLVTLAAGVGCCLFIERYCDLEVNLKWPNDLYCRHHKLGGILTETTPVSPNRTVMAVVGAGVNINTAPEDFPEEIRALATSLYAETGIRYSLKSCLSFMVEEIMQQVRVLEQDRDKLLARWNEHDYCKGKTIRWNTGRRSITGIGRGLMDDGRYSLEDQSGKMHAILAGRLQPVP